MIEKFLEKYAKATLRSHSATLRSGHITAYIWLAPAVARPIFCSATLRKTSDIRERYVK